MRTVLVCLKGHPAAPRAAQRGQVVLSPLFLASAFTTDAVPAAQLSSKDEYSLLIAIFALAVSVLNFVISQIKDARIRKNEKIQQQKKKYSSFLLGQKIVEAVQQKNMGIDGIYQSRALVALVDAKTSAKELDLNFDLPAWFEAIYETKGVKLSAQYDAEKDLRNRLSEQILAKYPADYQKLFGIVKSADTAIMAVPMTAASIRASNVMASSIFAALSAPP